MLSSTVRRLFCGAAALVLVAAPLSADEPKKDDNPAARPADRLSQKGWKERHERFLENAKKGGYDVVFLGDSITQGWEGSGKDVWKKSIEPFKALNLGIGGDRTEHVLWRITEGKELEGVKPRVFVIMIGTNNMGSNTPEQISGGVKAIVDELGKQRPDARVLLLGIFPRSAKPEDKIRDKVKATNEMIAKLADGKRVTYLDIGEKFLEKDGTLSREVMPDSLHLSKKGYEIEAEAITPAIEKLLK
jgi:lysophospholipase L1-like esterase